MSTDLATTIAPCTHSHRKDSTREACLRERTILAQHAAWHQSRQTMTDFWAEDIGGAITCTAHAGFYLSQNIQWHPSATIHHTPLGIWRRQSEREIAAFRHAIRDLPAEWSDYPCDTCRDHATAARDAGEATVTR